jgi:ribonuclease D
MPVSLSMSVLNIFHTADQRLIILFHDNENRTTINDALSLTDRMGLPQPSCTYSLLIHRCLAKNKKKPKNRTDIAV